MQDEALPQSFPINHFWYPSMNMMVCGEQRQPSSCRFLPVAVCDVLARCHSIPTAKKRSSFVRQQEENSGSDVDDEQVVVLAIRSRALEAKQRQKDNLISESLQWVLSPESGQFFIGPRGGKTPPLILRRSQSNSSLGTSHGAEEEKEEAFFSAGSRLSRCSSSAGEVDMKEEDSRVGKRWSMIEEFGWCEGWPFGLYRRRKALLLPPLPTSPSQSWLWRKRD